MLDATLIQMNTGALCQFGVHLRKCRAAEEIATTVHLYSIFRKGVHITEANAWQEGR